MKFFLFPIINDIKWESIFTKYFINIYKISDHQNSTSISTAELQATVECLDCILVFLPSSKPFLIATDSLSSLSAISNLQSTHPHLSRIHTLIHAEKNLNITITLVMDTKSQRHPGQPKSR